MKEARIFLILSLMLVIIPFCSSITINDGTVFNTTNSHSAITFGITVNFDDIEVDANFIYLTGISYIYAGISYSCSSYNHSEANTTIHAYQLCMTGTPASTTTTTQQPGGSTTIYFPSEKQLQNGYAKKVKVNDKVKFTFNDEEKIIKIKEVSEEEIIISIDDEDYSIDVNSIEKINFDGDNYYDFEIKVLNSDGTKTDMIFKMINEEIVSEKEEEKESPAKKEEEEESSYIYILIIFIVVLFIFIGLKKMRKR